DAFGIVLTTSLATTAKMTTIANNNFSQSMMGSSFGIFSDGLLRNVTISANSFSTAGSGTAVALAPLSPSAGVQILGNQVSGGNGIFVANMTKAKINGNSILSLGDNAIAIHLAGAVT